MVPRDPSTRQAPAGAHRPACTPRPAARRRAVRTAILPVLLAAGLVLSGGVALAQPGDPAQPGPVLPGVPLPPFPTANPAPVAPDAPVPPGTVAPEVAGVPADPPAEPPPPRTADEARDRLRAVQHDAEALTEQWHAATDDFTAKQEEADRLRAAVDPLRAEADRARADEETYRRSLEDITLAFADDGRLDQFSALLTSTDPQAYLDQMSALETLSADRLVVLRELHDKVEHAAQTQVQADEATTQAQTAADAAHRAADDIAARKAEADTRIDEAEDLLRRLSPRELRELNGPEEDAPDADWGTGVGAEALRAAATKLGKPYSWGASGPNRFDCSGLTSWAYRQAGITLPRSSSAQAGVGRSVSWDELQPGDLVFYYSPVSHVGIYAGDGKMINAPQSGDVVKYQKVNRSVFSGARRVG